jgi:hypothetical protein
MERKCDQQRDFKCNERHFGDSYAEYTVKTDDARGQINSAERNLDAKNDLRFRYTHLGH